MKIGVITFPGTLDDVDAVRAVRLAGGDPVPLWHADHDLRGVDAVVVPGGFSYGDYLRAGAIAARAPIMDEVVAAAGRGTPVLGICNGFQILCEAGLLPGVLRPNESLSFICRDIRVRVERADTPFTTRCSPGDELVIPVKHGEGSWFYPAEELAALEASGAVVLRYAEPCNGSVGDVAGVVNADGNVMGLMPHPEHAVDPLLGSSDGALILASLVDAARARALATV